MALFRAFSRLALRGFGGVLPLAHRTLVEEERWLTNGEFVEMLAFAQVVPGPNIGNLALMIGDRFFGLRGALAAYAGIFAAPLAIVMGLALLYAGFAEHPQVAAALRGMGAVTAGLIAAVALKALQARTPDQIGWLMLFSTFVLVGLMRWPLVWVMLGLGALSVALVWRKERRR
ncbi:MAG: chromate transporter [Quisquiliibacterium sp.]